MFLISDLALDPQTKKQKVQQFINPEMCKIAEDLVFTDPYFDAKTNQFNPLIKKEVQEIWGHDELKLEIARLRKGSLLMLRHLSMEIFIPRALWSQKRTRK